MKTIEEACNYAYKKAGENAYFGNGFNAGVKFANEWIKVEDELPEEICHKRHESFECITKDIAGVKRVGVYSYRLNKWFGFENYLIITHWRPIELI